MRFLGRDHRRDLRPGNFRRPGGGISIVSQLVGTGSAIIYAFTVSALIYGVLKMTVGIRLTPQEEMLGPDLVIHHVESRPEEAL